MEIKASNATIRLIGHIERSTGAWNVTTRRISDRSFSPSVKDQLREILDFDPSIKLALASEIELCTTDTSGVEDVRLEQPYCGLLSLLASSFPRNLSELQLQLPENFRSAMSQSSCQGQPLLRQRPAHSAIVDSSNNEEVFLFATVQPFLLQKRLSELLEWVSEEHSSPNLHPLVVAAIFHLRWLQLWPLSCGNVALGCALTERLLVDSGYSFVQAEMLSLRFCRQPTAYATALRHAEKSLGTTWLTCNMWLEFFLGCLSELAAEVLHRHTRHLTQTGLTVVQKQILSVVRNHGVVSRERIVAETGILLSTVKYNLSVLTERGHLQRIGNGRTTSYSAAA